MISSYSCSTLCLKKKRVNFETVYLKIVTIDFDEIWQKYSKDSRIEFACLSFCAGLLFLSTFLSCKPDTENNANFDAVSSKRANFDEYSFFIKPIPKLIIFGTHNLQTFRHNILINKVLLMQFYLFNNRPKLHHRKLRKLCITLFRTFSTSPAAC